MNFESIVYLASIVGGVVSFAIAMHQWSLTLQEQRRKNALESVKLSWELAAKLHEDEDATPALELLDGEITTINMARHGEFEVSQADILPALTESDNSPKSRAIRFAVDAMLYAIDRLRSAQDQKLIDHRVISAATYYYCRKIVSDQPHILDYATRNCYGKAVDFIRALAKSDR